MPEVLRRVPARNSEWLHSQCSKVEESINMGTVIVFNFDSIRERRLLTSDFDSQYGNCSGGHIIAVPKSYDSRFHDDAFRLFGKTKLGARNFFSPGRAIFGQNQFGGVMGSPAFCRL